MLSQAYKFS